jgi:uncharacterized membrane protein YbhN (UPF0104 family)
MSNNNSSGGAGFGSLLLIAFIVLKLCNVINWSWWWVLNLAWIWAGILLILAGVAGVLYLKEKRRERKVINKQGQMKSKWEQRLGEMQASKTKADEFRAQNKL